MDFIGTFPTENTNMGFCREAMQYSEYMFSSCSAGSYIQVLIFQAQKHHF